MISEILTAQSIKMILEPLKELVNHLRRIDPEKLLESEVELLNEISFLSGAILQDHDLFKKGYPESGDDYYQKIEKDNINEQ